DLASLVLANAPHNAASIVLVVGSDRYCLGFGSIAAIFNNTERLIYKQQTAAGQCPAIVTTTTTTTTTTNTSTTTLQSCGDGFTQAGEQCDDGNAVACDGCTACQFDRCGDGNLCANEGEQCDDSNNISGDGCNALCETEGQTCVGPITGARV